MNNKRLFQLLVLSVLGVCVMLPAQSLGTENPIILVSDGKSDYSIVIPDNPSEPEEYAARELRKFLAETGGAELEIFAESAAPEGRRIHVGRTGAAKDLLGESEYSSLGKEGFVIRASGGKDLVIAGGRPRGTLYGVYTFLEEVLGCRWYAPGVSVIPKKDRMEISGGLNISQTPAFEYREPFFHDAYDADWAARNKANGMRPALEAKHGGKISYAHFVHTFNELVPPDRYFKDHPEYFSLIDGKRVPDAQLCLSNPEVLEIAKAQLLIWMRENPDAVIFSVSQNDNMKSCQCEKCRATDREEGSPAGTLLRFVNAIADAAAAIFPDKFIDTLAYQYTEKAPLVTKPRPNVIVRLCHMAPSCDTHPLNKCFWNERYVRNLKAWRKIADKVYIWHYVTNFSHYPMLFPDVRAIAADMPFYHKNGVDGLFAQGSYQSTGGNMAELKAWLIAKLLWNPAADSKALIRDFFGGYYGPAAEPMLDYFYSLHKKTFDRTAHAHLYTAPSDVFLEQAALLHIIECFDRAEALAASSPEHLDRVKKERLGLTYVELTAPNLFGRRAADLQPGAPQDQKARLALFAKEIARFNVTNISEWQPASKSLEWLEEAVEKQLAGGQ